VQDDNDAEVFDEDAYRQEVLLSAGGIATAQRLDGNVGYLDIRTLHDANVAAPIASAAMTLLAGTDVLLIDLRRCPGGSPLMVAHYCSYLFDDPTHLNDIYDRPAIRRDSSGQRHPSLGRSSAVPTGLCVDRLGHIFRGRGAGL